MWVTNGPLSLYRKAYAKKIGGFDTNTVTEDIDITWNLLANGYKTDICLDARVSTIVPTKFRQWFRQRTRWGLGGLQAIFKYKRIFFKRGMFGAFILPFVSLSIVLSIFTFLFSSYLILKALLAKTLTVGYSASTSATILRLEDINLYPSVIIFYLIVLFTLSMSYSWYVFKSSGYEKKMTARKFFSLIFYSIVYLTLYPFVWFAAIHRFIKGDYSW
jgi:cellulose synthase/poly-beta-1,6-N-acetylglucosamine synthase-like glycosyltransferase